MARALDALHAIDPSCDRDTWVRVGMAARAAGLDFDVFDRWSAQADNYSPRDAATAWKSFEPDGGIGAGTLFKAARDAGWRPERNGHTSGATRAAERTKPARAGLSAFEVWARCVPATSAHPYIERKQGIPNRLRVLPDDDPLTIAGEHVAGALVVPVLPPLAGGDPASLQFILPTGKKLNLPGASMNGVFIVGELEQAGTAFLCEGVGQAWACWKATGFASVVCFGWGRVHGVAEQLRKRDPHARLVLVPDRGKETDANTIARDVGALVAPMPEGWPTNADTNDFALREGFDALEVLLSNAREAPKPEPRFKLLGSADLHALPPMVWRVRNLLPAQGVACVFGPSTSGKSFLSFDMAAAIVEGGEWFGYRVTPSRVVYVALEGAAGFRQRVEAWEQANGRALPDGLRLVLQPFKLTEEKDVQDMATAVIGAGGGVVLIDTLNASAPGIDENASRDMGIVLDATRTLQAATAGLVIVVHHTGKDVNKGLRGHSSLLAALDAAIEVTRDNGRRSWRATKVKDGVDGATHAFRLAVVDLAPDAEGLPVTSCVVRSDTAAADVARVRMPQGGNQRIILDALRPMFKASSARGKGGAPAVRPCLELEPAIEAARDRLTCPADKRTNRTRTAITGLIASGVLGCNAGWLWLK